MPILNKNPLLERILGGDKIAVVELARKIGCEGIGELVDQVCPTKPPSPGLFDVLADGLRLFEESEKPRPTSKR